MVGRVITVQIRKLRLRKFNWYDWWHLRKELKIKLSGEPLLAPTCALLCLEAGYLQLAQILIYNMTSKRKVRQISNLMPPVWRALRPWPLSLLEGRGDSELCNATCGSPWLSHPRRFCQGWSMACLLWAERSMVTCSTHADWATEKPWLVSC
jgi:hypothetical protein